MPLNPQIEAFLAMLAGLPPIDFATAPITTFRAINDQPIAMGPPPEVAHVEDLTADLSGRSLMARLYHPVSATDAPLSLTLFFHGGGWVMGTLDTHDATCRALARASGSAILSVAYRLAPEHPFPAGLDDGSDMLGWAVANADRLGIDPARIAVAGDSAGGNLAAAVAIRARNAGGPPLRHQLLLYPVTDRDFTRPSYQALGGGQYFLGTDAMKRFWDWYVGNSAPTPDLAAIHTYPDLSALPPATVITAEYDPLRDEGMAYASRLASAGVAVEARTAPGMIHGFISMFQAAPDALEWISYAGNRLRAALA